MPINLELKLQIDSINKIEKIIKDSGCMFAGILHQKDVYYSFKRGLLKLRMENGSGSLIKYLRDEKGKRWSNYEILSVGGKDIEKYLSEIFQIEAVVEKKRKLYNYKNTRIHLDRVKMLGEFLELETVVVKGKKEAEKEFKEIVEMLDLDLSKQIRTSYRNLLTT